MDEKALRFAVAGAMIGLFVPFHFGLWLFYSVGSSPPLAAGQPQCGMPVLGGIFMMVVGAPVCSIVLAIIGGVVGAICDMLADDDWTNSVETRCTSEPSDLQSIDTPRIEVDRESVTW